MANRMKEEEKNEKIIRGLLKLPANRRCINCNNLGPQYVCTNFWTFLCTNCSGVHREFTHRVKSVSMAKFTSQEVISLQEGGNERAKEIYFKEWDPQRHSFPDSSNIDRLRDFIKHVYVDRRYTGERNVDRPPRVKLGDKEDSSENRRADSYRGGSRSPPYDDRYSERAGSGGRNESRSPGYDHSDYKRSPGRFEVVDERRRDDRFGNGNQNQRFEDRRFPDGVPKPQGRSPNHQKDVDASSPPMVRPVRDILGDDTPTLRVGDPPKSNGTRITDNSAQTQRTLSSSSVGSSDGTSVQLKSVNLGSLIDFNADPEPTVSAPPQQSVLQQTTSTLTDAGDWASFDITGQQKAPQAAANANTLEFALAQLSGPGSASGGNMSTLHVSGVDSFPKTDGGPTMQQQQPSLFPAAINHFPNSQFNAPVAGALNQPRGSSAPSNLQTSLTASAGHQSQVTAKTYQEKSAEVLSQAPPEAKPIGRKELPQDFFTSMYPSVPTSAPSWQRGPHLGMGYVMQYPTGVTIPTFPHSSRSINPFDLVNEPASVQAATFPSMASLQGALPNMISPPDLLRTSSFGSPSPRWVTPQQPSYLSAVTQSPYMVQQIPSNMPQQMSNNPITMLHQGFGVPGIGGAAFGTSGADQQSAARYSHPGTPNSFGPLGGNPFG